MDENYLRISNKELFYAAMMLGVDRLVNVVYDFPTDEARQLSELDEVKRVLHKKKLLKESSTGEITLDTSVAACAAFCAEPDDCAIVDEEGFYATVYDAADSHMLLERLDDENNEARWFEDKTSIDEYIEQRLRGGQTNGGA